MTEAKTTKARITEMLLDINGVVAATEPEAWVTKDVKALTLAVMAEMRKLEERHA